MSAAPALLPLLLVAADIACSRRERRSEQLPAQIDAPVSVARDTIWTAPSVVPSGNQGALVRYGRELIIRTAAYFGPKGHLSQKQNGMNCQNCHLKAGVQPWGNNFGGVYSTYPKFRERRGGVETVAQRITDCFERSLNGTAPDTNSREVRAMISYIQWLGKDVPKGKKPKGSGLETLAYLDRAADPAKGKIVYLQKCASCHKTGGEGEWNKDRLTYKYPPLWGESSYNTGAGLFRLSRFAGFIKYNMPFGADYLKTGLTIEEAWDLAAFVNSQPRPQRDFARDWPDISLKPVDHPFGPYTDPYSEKQHKYGPFGQIQQHKKRSLKNTKQSS